MSLLTEAELMRIRAELFDNLLDIGAVPMIDIHVIGAGGGSIAFISEAGMLQVGPRSAGSVCQAKRSRPSLTKVSISKPAAWRLIAQSSTSWTAGLPAHRTRTNRY